MRPGWDREWKLWERDGRGIDHCRTGMGMGMTPAGTGQDRERLPVPCKFLVVVPCSWRVKAGMVCEWVAGKTV